MSQVPRTFANAPALVRRHIPGFDQRCIQFPELTRLLQFVLSDTGKWHPIQLLRRFVYAYNSVNDWSHGKAFYNYIEKFKDFESLVSSKTIEGYNYAIFHIGCYMYTDMESSNDTMHFYSAIYHLVLLRNQLIPAEVPFSTLPEIHVLIKDPYTYLSFSVDEPIYPYPITSKFFTEIYWDNFRIRDGKICDDILTPEETYTEFGTNVVIKI